MSKPNWENDIANLAREAGAYKVEAYFFIFEALEFTLKRLERKGHVSGRELLEGVRDLARERFGFLAKTVFDSWGVKKTDDFGSIVFALVNAGFMGKTEQDSIEEFSGVYDFEDAFVRGFRFQL